MNFNILFIHVSQPTKLIPEILLMPNGLIALADFIWKKGFNTKILHLEIEKFKDENFNLLRYIEKNKFHAICFDLHWHRQSYQVIKVLRCIKKEFPSVKIILGGFTASFFAREIMHNFIEVDYLIRGEAEVPLLLLIKEIIENNNQYDCISNLVWKEKEKIVENSISYVAKDELINNLSFSNFNLISNYNHYVKLHSATDFNKKENRNGIFYYSCGRGCPVNCSFCGGSSISQKLICNRTNINLCDHNSILKELKNLKRYNIDTWFTSFDPFPKSNYYIELFKKIRQENVQLDLIFESWGLPSMQFILEFSKTFGDKSRILLSPDCGSEYIRNRNKGYFYTNTQLLDTVDYLQSSKIKCELFFTAGLPYEKKEDIHQTVQLINFYKKKFPEVLINICPIEYEPAAPYYLDRDRYEIESSRSSFIDFYRDHQKNSDIGYRTGSLSKKEIRSIQLELLNL